MRSNIAHCDVRENWERFHALIHLLLQVFDSIRNVVLYAPSVSQFSIKNIFGTITLNVTWLSISSGSRT